jgi:hypothetical protein
MKAEETYPASSDETNFLSRDGGAGNGGGLSDVLVVTTTMRMVNGVHSNTTSTRPAENSVMVELKRLGKRTHL